MKWTVLNSLGALLWVAGLFVTKSASLPGGAELVPDHPGLYGLVFGLAGLATLLYANFRSA